MKTNSSAVWRRLAVTCEALLILSICGSLDVGCFFLKKKKRRYNFRIHFQFRFCFCFLLFFFVGVLKKLVFFC